MPTRLAAIAICAAVVAAVPAASRTNDPLAAHGGAHAQITAINGAAPRGTYRPLEEVVVLLDITASDGQRLVVTRGIRRAGTRAPIHVHEHGGHTCVLSGTITDFVEGQPDTVWPAGTCYYMPANTPMTAANLGTEDAVLMDTFKLPPGAPTITIVEQGLPR